MTKEQLEQHLYQAYEEGFYAGFCCEGNPGCLDSDWQEYRNKLAQELGW